MFAVGLTQTLGDCPHDDKTAFTYPGQTLHTDLLEAIGMAGHTAGCSIGSRGDLRCVWTVDPLDEDRPVGRAIVTSRCMLPPRVAIEFFWRFPQTFDSEYWH